MRSIRWCKTKTKLAKGGGGQGGGVAVVGGREGWGGWRGMREEGEGAEGVAVVVETGTEECRRAVAIVRR